MQKKTIVYVPRRSRIRLYKIAKAVMLSQEFRLVLVCEESFYDEDLFKGIFDEVIFYNKKSALFSNKYFEFLSRKLVFSRGLPDLLSIVKELNPFLIHAFCEPYDHIEYLLKRTDYPLIMSDGADFSGISGGLENINSITRKQEKFAFENVNGLIYKGPKLVTEYYRRFGYNIDCEEMTWFDHCDEDFFVEYPRSKLSDKDGELHLVYTGNISVNPEVKYCYYPPLGRILAKQRIHLHLYPNPYQYKTSPEYTELDKTEPYFHFHEPVPLKGLIKEISKYDWGLWVHAEDPSFRTQQDKMATGIGNKLFTYLEAGLPVVVSDSRIYGTNLVQKHEIGFSINDSDWINFKNILESVNYPELQKVILEKRAELSLRNNFNRLVDFYNKFAENS